MTEALATLFEGKEIRTLERAGEPWFPIKDLADAWGMDRTTPHKILMRNSEAFRGFVCGLSMCDKMSPSDTGFCVNERGLYLLIGKITTGKLKNQEAAAAILRFQRWVPSLIQQYRKKEIVPIQQPQSRIINELQEAREIAALCGKSPELFQAAVLKKHGKAELAEVLDASPSVIHSNAGYYTPTRLIELFCRDPLLTPKRFNKFLSNFRVDNEWRPFQYRDENKIWRLAPRGIPHGKEIMYEVPDSGGHKEIRILWNESILYASGLKHRIADDQVQIPARVGSGC
jgi:prophage antirepressor-like protein